MSKNESGGLAVIVIAVVLLGLMLPCLAGAGLVALRFLSFYEPPPPLQPPPIVSAEPIASDATVATVCEITAAQMGVDAAQVHPSTSLADLGADELDIVELVMELEEEFDVSIPDQAITSGTGSEEWAAGSDKLTMRKLAEIVEQQQTRSTTP